MSVHEPPSSPALLHARAWIELHAPIDLQLSPLGLRAMEALDPRPGEVVLDVGCGTGQTLRQLAGRVGTSGRVIGVDVAAPLLDVAAQGTAALGQVSLVRADAQTLGLRAGSLDAVFSRFGVMGFTDPVAAFANLRGMLRPGGRLALVCWRALAENELDLLPLRAAGLEARADATPFGLADPGHLRAVLEAAGLADVTLRAHDAAVSSGGVEAMAAVLLRVGALGRVLRENPGLRGDAEPRLRAALRAREVHGRVALRAATWIVTACRGMQDATRHPRKAGGEPRGER